MSGLVSKPATATDVARMAGVSTAVVSYVVNEGPRPVAPDTADRVRRAIALLGYSPNFTARALSRGQTQMLGLVLSDSTNPYYAELAHAVQDEARKRGQMVVTVNHGDSVRRQSQLIHDLTSRGADHILIASHAGTSDDALAGSVPTVLIDCAQAVEGAATIGPSSEAGTAGAVRHLIEDHNMDRVAIALGESGQFGAENRERGWRRACRDAGVDEGPVERAPFGREGGYSIGRRLMALPQSPRAIFASSDLQAFGLLRAIWESGRSVPEDVAVISFDGTLGSRYSWPTLTAVRQPVKAMAAAAVEVVLEPGGPRPSHRSFPMDLVLRRSCGCPDVGDGTDEHVIPLP